MRSPYDRGEMTQALYGPDLAHVHDVAFGDWVREAAPFVLARLRESGIEEGLVVDLGCGSGIWAAELLGAGYEALGVDASAEMLAPGSDRDRCTMSSCRRARRSPPSARR